MVSLVEGREIVADDEAGAGGAAAGTRGRHGGVEAERGECRRRAGNREILRRAGVQRDRTGACVDGRGDAGDGADLVQEGTDRVGDVELVAGGAAGHESDHRAVDRDGIAGDEARRQRVARGGAGQCGCGGDRGRRRGLVQGCGAGDGIVTERRGGRSQHQWVLREIGRVEAAGGRQRAGDRSAARRGRGRGRKICRVLNRAGGLCRHEIVLKLEHLRNVANRVAGLRIDRDAHQIIAGAIDQIAVGIDLEIAAAGIVGDAAEDRRVVDRAGGGLHREEAVPVDRHVGRDGRCRDRTLGRDRRLRIGGDAAGDLPAGCRRVGDEDPRNWFRGSHPRRDDTQPAGRRRRHRLCASDDLDPGYGLGIDRRDQHGDQRGRLLLGAGRHRHGRRRAVFSGITDYTRRGDFQVNANGNLVNGAGYYLMGVAVDPKTGNPIGNVPQVLQFQNNFVPAQATSAI